MYFGLSFEYGELVDNIHKEFKPNYWDYLKYILIFVSCIWVVWLIISLMSDPLRIKYQDNLLNILKEQNKLMIKQNDLIVRQTNKDWIEKNSSKYKAELLELGLIQD